MLVGPGVVLEPEEASRLDGVPARRAQPDSRGPVIVQAAMTMGTTRLAPRPARRGTRGSGQPATTRHQTARMTAPTQPKVTRSIQVALGSVPVPRPCTTASPQQAYASQCTILHAG